MAASRFSISASQKSPPSIPKTPRPSLCAPNPRGYGDRRVHVARAGRCAGPPDHRSDLFSFGLILYELMAAKSAFRGETSAEIMTAIALASDGRLTTPVAPGNAIIRGE